MKKLKYLLVLSFIFIWSISCVSASTWTTKVSITNIPAGDSSKDSSKYNTKTNYSTFATFNASKISAALGNSARLINSNGALRSEWINLKVNSSTYAKEYDCVVNHYYYPRVKSHSIEWGSNSVTFKFSSDKK